MIRPGSSMSKAKAMAKNANAGPAIKQDNSKKLKVEDFIAQQDWVGAITLLELEAHASNPKPETVLWLAYCYFHNGDYKKAISIYDELMRKPDYDKNLHTYKACCLFALCNYDEAKKECQKGSESPLQIRLLFHIAHKKEDKAGVMTYHNKLKDSVEDQLCIAAYQYLDNTTDEACDIYNKLATSFPDYHALNYYLALCYYKMDKNDMAIDCMMRYLSFYPLSVNAVNLKACCIHQSEDGALAESEFKNLAKEYKGGNIYDDFDLLRFNQSVFRNGENALQVFPPLMEAFPEAKLNLAIYYLKQGQNMDAFKMIKDIRPANPHDYVLKAVTFCILGEEHSNPEYIRQANQWFNAVGTSEDEENTITGRQCMSTYYFLNRDWSQVYTYLNSIIKYCGERDDFKWNFGLSECQRGNWKEGAEFLAKIQSEKYKSDYLYSAWLTRAYIMSKQPDSAWDVYISMEPSQDTSILLLQIIANDCYSMGFFYYAMKAFDILERIDTDSEYYEAKTGALAGVFQQTIAGKETHEHLAEAFEAYKSGQLQPSAEKILRVVKKWGNENGVMI